MMRGERGIALIHVLAMGVLSLILATAILRSRLQPAMAAAAAVDRVSDDLAEQAALNKITAVWAARGSCASDASVGVSCAGTGCSCDCTAAGMRVRARPSGASCSLLVRR